MNIKSSKIITITMPLGLLTQIDVLAKQNFATRSDILRQAALAYIRQSDLDGNEVERLSPKYADQQSKPKPKKEYDYEMLAKKYPHVHGDREMLAFLDDYDNNRL